MDSPYVGARVLETYNQAFGYRGGSKLLLGGQSTAWLLFLEVIADDGHHLPRDLERNRTGNRTQESTRGIRYGPTGHHNPTTLRVPPWARPAGGPSPGWSIRRTDPGCQGRKETESIHRREQGLDPRPGVEALEALPPLGEG